MTTAAVLGAGSWGTALAIQLAKNGHQVRAWDHDAELISALITDRQMQILQKFPRIRKWAQCSMRYQGQT